MFAPDADPFRLFERIYERAQIAGVPQADAMTLATATPDGKPSARVVLLKGVVDGAFAFYTNYESRKSLELIENPRAAVVFYWQQIQWQVRAEGAVRKCTEEQSRAYWSTRPRDSQLSAWASRQSAPIASRADLEKEIERLRDAYSGSEIPCPPFWGGFLLVPERIEFWLANPNRLHERYCYLREGIGWKLVELAP